MSSVSRDHFISYNLFYFLVHVIDDSDPNWWKGSNQRGEGLFPANFVSSDLEVEPEVSLPGRDGSSSSSRRVQFNEQVVVTTLEETASSEAELEIDEAKIDKMLHLLHEADPTGDRPDPDEMKLLEGKQKEKWQKIQKNRKQLFFVNYRSVRSNGSSDRF